MSNITDEIERLQEITKLTLSKKRYIHSKNVADMSYELARINGFDPVKAYKTGLIHDIQKEISRDEMREMVLKSGYNTDPVELETPPVWHGIAGAYYARTKLGITDEDELLAIRYHTVACADMSVLMKIVYLADLVSAERKYKDVEKFRAYAFENLDYGMFMALRWSITNIAEKGNKIPTCTLEAYNFYSEYKK